MAVAIPGGAGGMPDVQTAAGEAAVDGAEHRLDAPEFGIIRKVHGNSFRLASTTMAASFFSALWRVTPTLDTLMPMMSAISR